MIPTLHPYPTYKPSGVPWLGDVPAHWDLIPNRVLVSLKKDLVGNRAGNYTLLSLTKQGIIPRNLENASGKFPSSFDTYQVVEAGDLIFCLFDIDETPRTVGLSRLNGMVTGAYTRFVCGDCNLREFLLLLYLSLDNRKLLKPLYSGLRKVIPRTSFLSAKVALPPEKEQAAIVRYLDYVDRRIRRYATAKQKLIALLEEERQAVISQAVTRSLDPNVRLKPSGVESLGNVPEHWEILPLKRWVSTKITDGPHETPALLSDGTPFMSAESMVGGRLDFSRCRGFISREQYEVYSWKCRPQRDDIFMCKSGATTGKVAIVETTDEFSVWSPLALIRVDPQKVLTNLLFAVLQARYVQQQVQETWSYGTQPNLSMGAMERLVIVLPPIDEQREVLAHLNRATRRLSEAVDHAQRAITLVQEYRTRLIADVVTGKLDVREVAAHLPVEGDDQDLIQRTDSSTHDSDEDFYATNDSEDKVPIEAPI